MAYCSFNGKMTDSIVSCLCRKEKVKEPMSYEELLQLGNDILEVPAEKMSQVIQIIHSNEWKLNKQPVPDEFDILVDKLKPSTQWKLKSYMSLLHKKGSGEYCSLFSKPLFKCSVHTRLCKS